MDMQNEINRGIIKLNQPNNLCPKLIIYIKSLSIFFWSRVFSDPNRLFINSISKYLCGWQMQGICSNFSFYLARPYMFVADIETSKLSKGRGRPNLAHLQKNMGHVCVYKSQYIIKEELGFNINFLIIIFVVEIIQGK